MKITKKHLIVALLMVGLCPYWLSAQDQRTLETKIIDILALTPFRNSEQGDKKLKELTLWGAEAYDQLLSKLKAPKEGGDNKVRYLLGRLADYVSTQPEAIRKPVADSYLSALDKIRDKDVKGYILRALRLFAKEEAVAGVSPYLQDRQLSTDASAVLVAIGDTAAEEQLVSALSKTTDPFVQKQLLNALAFMKSEKVRSNAWEIYRSTSDNELKKMALHAIAEAAHKADAKALLQEANAAQYAPDAIHTVRHVLDYAKNSLDVKVASAVLKKGRKHTGYMLSAMAVYVKADPNKALSILLKYADTPDEKLRNGILEMSMQIKGEEADKEWVTKATKASAALKADIIYMFGRRKATPTSVNHVKSGLLTNDVPIVANSMEAIVKMSKQKNVPNLNSSVSLILSTMKAQQDRHNAAAEKALQASVGKRDLSEIETAIAWATPAQRAIFLRIFAARGMSAFTPTVLTLCEDKDAMVRKEAFRSLKGVAGRNDLVDLFALLQRTADKQEVSAVQQALIRAITKMRDTKTQASAVQQLFRRAKDKTKMLPVLAGVGGSASVTIVKTLFDKGNVEKKNTALSALASWKSSHTFRALFQIMKNEPNYRDKAYRGYVSMVSKAPWKSEQKLLMLRQAEAYAPSIADKNKLIEQLGNLPIFPTLVYLRKFLQDNDINQQAARSIIKIVMPASGQRVGMYGTIAREALTKAMKIITGPETDYWKENIKKYLEKMPPEEGFVSMFNGRDLTGWGGLVGNPVSRSKMSKTALEKEQKKADAEIKKSWKVENGCIVFTGKGNNLCSEKKYGDFEMWVDWLITKDGDSGIYLRGSPQVQIWDTSRHDVGAQVGSGGLYNNSKHPRNPLKLADNAIGEWNTFYIKMIGERVTVYLNGELVVDNVVMENYWDRKIPIFPEEAIELQAHGTDLKFRDIYVRELGKSNFGLSEEEKKQGFVSLFNGRDLENWQGNMQGHFVSEEGTLTFDPQREKPGNLYSQKEYANFVLRFEFKLTEGANNGLAIRSPLEGDAAYQGMELQILDNRAEVYKNLKEYQYHGSVYGVIAAKRGYQKPLGQWNRQEVIVNGFQVKVILNDMVILDGDIKQASQDGTLDEKAHPGLLRPKGHIGFLSHGSFVEFRNIRIKELK